MNHTGRSWLLALMIAGAGMAYIVLGPDSYEVHRQQVLEQFHLPDDVEFLELHTGYRRGAEFVEATLQLTESQYDAFVAEMGAWPFVPLEHDGVLVETADEGWNRWWDGDMSVIVDLDASPYGEAVRARERALRKAPSMAIRWVDWGHIHGKPANGDWTVWDAGRHRSLCWGGGELDGDLAARPCTAYPPSGGRPAVVVRGLLDDEARRLFVHID